MYREEILDMAMDILDNTDATLEEAMGVALETLKSGEKNKVRGLNYAESRRTRDDRVRKAYRGKGRPVVTGGSSPDGYEINAASKGELGFISMDRGKNDILIGGHSRNIRSDLNAPKTPRGGHDFTMGASPKQGHSSLSITNHRSGREYGSASGSKNSGYTKTGVLKEAAIMDTALDFLDMYDVSLEEAIDMAYDYIG